MILCRLQGGLGNQMFQFAFGRMLALKNRTVLKIDTSLLQQNKGLVGAVVRDLDLDIFELEQQLATPHEISYFNGYPETALIRRLVYRIEKIIKPRNLIIQNNHDFNTKQLEIGDNSCIVGRWQSAKYFEAVSQDIKKNFSIKKQWLLNSPFQEQISKCSTAISLHVRREDVIIVNGEKKVSGLVNGNLPLQYYKNAVAYCLKKFENPSFFVFSENTEWCEKNLSFIDNALLIKPQRYKKGMAEDLFLITKCKHHIISNSTFSWWGAWLSENADKVVIAPHKWSFTSVEFEPPFILPDEWIKMDAGKE